MSAQKIKLANVLQAPIISEKSTNAADQNNQFVFKVQKTASKLQVKQAVELMFNVKVESVRVLNVKGKIKRFGRSIGKRSDWKKAYIKLESGHSIELATA
ncbi:50S ribosomal protein L23 [Methylomonas sp. MED-D]|uniref:Large ribosomal subunit protein uL23 n=1 Tax=Methylomonas koyamae TaxID=702114 RepID=A0A177NSW1_9GAMM|nr:MULTISPECIES: 50S ribosomal protein L23 [Methylomonas]MDT4330022.1 50S ribosomal protein L23 [Methylomonas sp. MV1]OAI20319.1 50S ribosomal protein L23 [Methylomonas koyamae]OHX35929.1 50S ribosomal protein L23 [Methylomonas sp. LWB]WGS86849.1 50S ribosomal protein L23 [Methylomonas sp. UP202]